VKLQFLPPPMEGTISLGIYDHAGKRVRTLHCAAKGNEFVAALDGYITFWDGLDDAGQPLPAGHYSASGYMVGAVNVQHLPWPAPPSVPIASGSGLIPGSSPTLAAILAAPGTLAAALPSLNFPNGKPFVPQSKIRVALVGNPLDRDRAGSAELSAGFDAAGSWLELADGLPLKQISTTPNLKWAVLGRATSSGPIVVFQSDGSNIQEFIITKVSSMMEFDCGGFDYTPSAR